MGKYIAIICLSLISLFTWGLEPETETLAVSAEEVPVPAPVVSPPTKPAPPQFLKAVFEKEILNQTQKSETEHLEYMKNLESFETQLKELSLAGTEKRTSTQVRNQYNAVKKIWKQLGHQIIVPDESFEWGHSWSPLPPPEENWSDSHKQDYENIENARLRLEENYLQRRELHRKDLQRIFKQASIVRSNFIKLSIKNKNQALFAWSREYIEDIKMEFLIIPFHLKSFFEGRISEIKSNLYGGFYGISRLLKELFIIFLVLISPLFLFKLLRVLTDYLDLKRKEFIRKSYRHSEYGRFALWIRRLNPYLPWIIFYFAVSQMAWALAETTLSEPFAILSPYIHYYILYRLFRLLIESGISQLLRKNRSQKHLTTKTRMEGTSRFVGRFFLFLVFVLQTFKAAVGEGLIYLQISAVAWWIGYFIISYACLQWRDEITRFLENIGPQSFSKNFIALCQSRFRILFCFPAAIYIFCHFTFSWIVGWGQKFELIKKISLKILRIRLESGQRKKEETVKVEIPEAYKTKFSEAYEAKNQTWIEPVPKFSQSVFKNIQQWANGQGDDESILAIYGEMGIGKTKLLERLHKMTESLEAKTIYIDMSQKFVSKKGILNHFSKLLGVNFSDKSLEIASDADPKEDLPREKTVVFIDDAQDLFLAQLGGFDGFKAFIELINAKAKDIFWCVSFAEQPWVFLNCIFGQNHYFRKEISMPPWSAEAIQSLIQTAHNQTEYALTFDEVLYAASTERNDGESVNIEDRFFDLLWEQCQGNPAVAKHLWLKSISKVQGKSLQLALPKSVDFSTVGDLTDDMYFVFASVFRHENLSIQEAMRSTNLPFGLVRQAFYRGFEEGILQNLGNQRFRVAVEWTHPLLKQLKRRNMLYGK